jgi:two-component system chemotaxis response regulator CheY
VRFDPLKILLVDDNHHMRLLLTEMLRAIGVRHIFEALDGAEALSMMRHADRHRHHRPEDGRAGRDRLRQPAAPLARQPQSLCPRDHDHRPLDGARVHEARDAGVNEFLTKPVTARGVVHRLTLLIEKPRAFVRSGDYFGPDRRRRDDPDHKGPRRRRGSTTHRHLTRGPGAAPRGVLRPFDGHDRTPVSVS